MENFDDFNLPKQLKFAIKDLGFTKPTPIQEQSFSLILSGKDIVGVAQTGTGKSFAYMLPILTELKFSDQVQPRVLILVPTRELVIQMVENIESYAKYQTVRTLGVYGGTNINTQKQAVSIGCDILVATPGRLRDLALSGVLQLKMIKKLVVDEVDVMLDLGFRPQLMDIFDIIPEKRQNILFSATMTEEVDGLLDTFFVQPKRVAIAVSGTPLKNISQTSYRVQNFYTKVNLLTEIVKDKTEFTKVLVFVDSKKSADRMMDVLEDRFGEQMCVIHSNKSQNYRIRSIEQFNDGRKRILIATDVIARGLDLEKISHVINMDTPAYPENYMHRIGRTGRAEESGKSILFYTDKEEESKIAIEMLMNYEIPLLPLPKSVEISKQLTPEERPVGYEINAGKFKNSGDSGNAAFHEKKAKNLRENEGGKYRKELAKKYKKPQRRGDKIQNMKARKKF
jgi:ATP-dependent RNA helicase RhlE